MNISKRLCDELSAHIQHGTKPRIPAGGQLLWTWFFDLSRRRTYHAAGPNPIGLAEIAAYRDLYRVPFDERHVAILCEMDEAYLNSIMKRGGPDADGTKRLPARLDVRMTGDLFDAMFG